MTPDLSDQPVFDEREAMILLEEDRELLNEVVELFIELAPECLAEIETAGQSSDADRLRQAAHALMGSAANVCAQRVRIIAAAMEELAEVNDLAACTALIPTLREEFDRFCSEAELTP